MSSLLRDILGSWDYGVGGVNSVNRCLFADTGGCHITYRFFNSSDKFSRKILNLIQTSCTMVSRKVVSAAILICRPL
jgi:hypothetical protein